jgi:hypothetical protein
MFMLNKILDEIIGRTNELKRFSNLYVLSVNLNDKFA